MRKKRECKRGEKGHRVLQNRFRQRDLQNYADRGGQRARINVLYMQTNLQPKIQD